MAQLRTTPQARVQFPHMLHGQNRLNRSSLSSGRLPTIKAALIAPIEVPMTQSDSMPASCRAS